MLNSSYVSLLMYDLAGNLVCRGFFGIADYRHGDRFGKFAE